MANELFELARRRRSCRKYTSEKISDEIVDEILKVALLAPSSWGGHPIEFVVVRDKSTIQKIARCKRIGAPPLLQADVAIVVMANTAGLELWIEDSAVASTYILLATEQFNVDACRIHIRNHDGQRLSDDEEIRKILGVPDKFSVLNVVNVTGDTNCSATFKVTTAKNSDSHNIKSNGRRRNSPTARLFCCVKFTSRGNVTLHPIWSNVSTTKAHSSRSCRFTSRA